MKPRHTAEQSTVRVNKAEKMGKTGFASVSGTLGGNIVPEKKAVFAAPLQKSLEIEVSAPAARNAVRSVETISPVEKLQGYKSLPEMALDINSKKNESKIIMTMGKTCPTDPSELNQCDSCQ